MMPDESWIIAVLVSVSAAFINNIGVNFQKLYYKQNQPILWMVGMVAITSASILDFTALSFAPQSVVAPIGSLTIVSNAIIAPLMHKEKLTFRVGVYTLIVFAGCLTSVLSASHENTIHHTKDVSGMLSSATSAGYMIGLLTALAFSLNYADSFSTWLPALISAIFGSLSVTSAKILNNSVVYDRELDEKLVMVMAFQVVLVGMQLIWLNIALSLADALLVVPVFTSSWIIFTAISGGMMYGEFNKFTSTQAVLFPLGIATCCFGVTGLVRNSA